MYDAKLWKKYCDGGYGIPLKIVFGDLETQLKYGWINPYGKMDHQYPIVFKQDFPNQFKIKDNEYYRMSDDKKRVNVAFPSLMFDPNDPDRAFVYDPHEFWPTFFNGNSIENFEITSKVLNHYEPFKTWVSSPDELEQRLLQYLIIPGVFEIHVISRQIIRDYLWNIANVLRLSFAYKNKNMIKIPRYPGMTMKYIVDYFGFDSKIACVGGFSPVNPNEQVSKYIYGYKYVLIYFP